MSKKFRIELPKFRLELHARLVKRRKPLLEDPILPSASLVKKKYRTGTLPGKIVRYLSEHKSVRKLFAANMAAVVIATTFLPVSQATNVKAAEFTGQDGTVIQTQNNLETQKGTQFPLSQIKINQYFSFFHPGVDLGAKIGSIIKPVKSGIVIEAGYVTDGYGNTILIDHGKGLTSRYAHLSKIEVTVGERVTTDTEIGKVGVSGHSTGPHLHLEIRQNGFPLNPLTVLPR